MVYGTGQAVEVPQCDVLTFLFESRHCAAREATPLHAEAADPAGTTITKARARALTQQLAHALRARYGVGGGDVVVVLSTGQSGLPCLFYGVVAADGVYSAASPAAPAADVAAQLRDGDRPAVLLVCSPDLRARARAAARLAGLPADRVLVLRSTPAVRLETLGGLGGEGAPGAEAEAAAEENREEKEEEEEEVDGEEVPLGPQMPWRVITDPDELRRSRICILYSSGTTGRPKGVVISHANMVAEAFLPATVNRPVWAGWAARGAPFASRTLAHLPPAHVSGVQGYFVNPFFDGGLVYWMPAFDFAAFLRHCAALRITTFFSLPKIYLALARHPAVTDQLAALRIAYSGAAPLPAEARACAKFGGPGDRRALLSQTWGSSETTGAVTHMPPDRRDVDGSVGALLPNMTMRLVDEHGNDVPEGEPGEAWLKGPVVTQGYYCNEEANRQNFTDDGWLRMGDIIQVKGDLLYVVGRTKEIFKYHGLQVAPAELEALLCEHAAVADAAVAGVPSEEEEGEEVPRALVALRPGVQLGAVSAADVAAWVAARVADHKRLRGGVVFVPEVPRLPSGKIARARLRELALRGDWSD